jgi:low affinity Fe/Cu permease
LSTILPDMQAAMRGGSPASIKRFRRRDSGEAVAQDESSAGTARAKEMRDKIERLEHFMPELIATWCRTKSKQAGKVSGENRMDRIFAAFSHRVARWSGQPLAFMLSITIVLLWVLTGPLFHYSDTWQLVINTGTTIVTFVMVFLIQNAQNRDGSAIQAKLDELIRAMETARNDFIGIEHLTEAELERIKIMLERECEGDEAHRIAFERLIARR